MQIEKPVIIRLQLHSEASGVMALLTFENKGDNPIYLDKISIGLNEPLKRNVFEIMDSETKKLPYTGYMMKRKISEKDFIELKSGETVKTNVNLNLVYKLLPKTIYKIKYSVRNPSHPNGQASFLMESNQLEFTL